MNYPGIATMPDNQPAFRNWAPDFDGLPNSWMRIPVKLCH
jgi:hypothetical protein